MRTRGENKLESILLGRGGGRVVSVLPFYSEDLSSSPTVVKNLSVKLLFEKNENQQKEAGVGPFKNYSKQNSLPLGSIPVLSS